MEQTFVCLAKLFALCLSASFMLSSVGVHGGHFPYLFSPQQNCFFMKTISILFAACAVFFAPLWLEALIVNIPVTVFTKLNGENKHYVADVYSIVCYIPTGFSKIFHDVKHHLDDIHGTITPTDKPDQSQLLLQDESELPELTTLPPALENMLEEVTRERDLFKSRYERAEADLKQEMKISKDNLNKERVSRNNALVNARERFEKELLAKDKLIASSKVTRDYEAMAAKVSDLEVTLEARDRQIDDQEDDHTALQEELEEIKEIQVISTTMAEEAKKTLVKEHRAATSKLEARIAELMQKVSDQQHELNKAEIASSKWRGLCTALIQLGETCDNDAYQRAAVFTLMALGWMGFQLDEMGVDARRLEEVHHYWATNSRGLLRPDYDFRVEGTSRPQPLTLGAGVRAIATGSISNPFVAGAVIPVTTAFPTIPTVPSNTVSGPSPWNSAAPGLGGFESFASSAAAPAPAPAFVPAPSPWDPAATGFGGFQSFASSAGPPAPASGHAPVNGVSAPSPWDPKASGFGGFQAFASSAAPANGPPEGYPSMFTGKKRSAEEPAFAEQKTADRARDRRIRGGYSPY